jgi:threonine dehydrogenase-like Zn-dependent dehydrogenase
LPPRWTLVRGKFPESIWPQEVTFIGTYCYTTRDFADTFAAMLTGRLGPLDWYETRPLADGARAFADIRAGRNAAPKIVLQPPRV